MTPTNEELDAILGKIESFDPQCGVDDESLSEAKAALQALIEAERLEAVRTVLKPLDEITDRLGDDYGELDAQEDMEAYVTKTLKETNAALKAARGLG